MLGMTAYLSFDAGRIVGSISEENFSNIQEKINTQQFLKIIEDKKDKHVAELFMGDMVIYKTPDQKNIWIDDFKNNVNKTLLNSLRDKNVKIIGDVKIDLVGEKKSIIQELFKNFLGVVGQLVLILFYIGFGLILFMQFRQSPSFSTRFNRVNKDSKSVVKIRDVAGHEGPKKELLEIVDYLKEPEKYKRTGARPPYGVLLYGPPGNGKTLLAKAVAGEANANFIEQNASSFMQLYVGAGAMAVRSLFKEARKVSPCVIFIDEIDSVGSSREKNSNEEKVQTVNALLAELDGFMNKDGVVVIAATNRIENLDEALIRPGRFDRKVFIPLPSKKDRLEILALHMEKIPKPDIDLVLLSEQTKGFSGADLANLVNEAAIEASRENVEIVSMKHFQKARDRVLLGARNHGRENNLNDKKFIAYHELGHAFTQMITKGKRVEKVSILPRGMALGITLMHQDDEEKLLQTKEDIKNELVVLMGGRAAEEVFCGTITGGAADDMNRASKLSREAIRRMGFDGLGPYIPDHPDLMKDIEIRAAEWVKEAYEKAKVVLVQRSSEIHFLAEELMKNDELSGEYIEDFIKKNKE